MNTGFDENSVIIEFYSVGAYVKVSAIDPRTLVEVSIVGDPQRGEAALRQAVLRKLRFILEKRAKGGRGGLVV